MNNPKVSVVMPCYHVGQYLPNIHADFLAQTVQDFELIYVNDGDKGLSNMLQSFAEKDDRVVVIEKENGGLSAARNDGLEKARGEWVIFTDPDDRVEPYYLESLLSTVEGTDNVLGVGGFRQIYESQKVEVDYFLSKNDNHVAFKDCFPNWNDILIGMPWNRIFRTAFLRENNLKFRKLWPEDMTFMFEVYPHVDYLGIVKDCGYRYLMHANTQTSKYHDNLKEIKVNLRKTHLSLLRMCGLPEEEIEKKEDSVIALDLYLLVINIFNRTTPLSFSEKIRYIREELMGDKEIMGLLEKHDISKDKKIVKLTTKLMLTRKAWLVAWVFRTLFALKNNFKSLYFWYDAHFSGKFSKN